MIDEVSAKNEQAQKRALRLQTLSLALEEAERKRDKCLYKFLDEVHGIAAEVRKLATPVRVKVLGEKYNPFQSARQIPSLVLQRVGPELGKKRWKYAAVLNYAAANKGPGETVEDFVRNNGGINRCVTEEKKLRKRAARRSKT
jgi:hypothetical protein